ncbi:MAG TPA: sporulation membrane protein YtaF [Tissierellaceae bacterium]|nr:sporulation membrane protein YtaF [Tissierellaceae bacterium]
METILLVLVVSLDAFVASIAYGSKRIKIPFSSNLVINIICSSILGISLFFGYLVQKVVPSSVTTIISFLLLFSLGIYSLFESLIKTYLKSRPDAKKEVRLKIFDVDFIINIYLDKTNADLDDSKRLDFKEALYLGTALSLDSLAIGFSNSFGNVNYFHAVALSFIVNMIAINGGLFLGKEIVKKTNLNLSWLAGTILIILAFLKFK